MPDGKKTSRKHFNHWGWAASLKVNWTSLHEEGYLSERLERRLHLLHLVVLEGNEVDQGADHFGVRGRLRHL